MAKRSNIWATNASRSISGTGCSVGRSSSAIRRSTKSRSSGSAIASATVSCPRGMPRWASAECDAFTSRSFISSYGPVSSTISAPARSHAGRSPSKRSMIHSENGSVMTVSGSSDAGVMRSATVEANVAPPPTARRVTSPFAATLSHDRTAIGSPPRAARPRASSSIIGPS